MHTKIRHLCNHRRRKIPAHILTILFVVGMVGPPHAVGTNPTEPYQQEFVITAYYSPKPGQCCYVRGGYIADKILNGEGHTAADGTPVYPGMLAGPPSYAFGTKVQLPGVGTLTVHDRGGAIQVLNDGAHRLDIWVGEGEEGLARALAFGVQRISGTVYPVGSAQPETQVDFSVLSAPADRLKPFDVARGNLMRVNPTVGSNGLSVFLLQEKLSQAGYFDRAPTGFFGPETEDALNAFRRDFHVLESGNDIGEKTAAMLMAASIRSTVDAPIDGNVDASSSQKVIQQAQRLLRDTGYYRGRTDGIYDEDLAASILTFQQDNGLAGNSESPGAGRIGPITLRTLTAAWNRRRVEDIADEFIMYKAVEAALEERGTLSAFLEYGHMGKQVTYLQQVLSEQGYFPAEKINGNFGDLTKSAVTEYQIDAGIIASRGDLSAGRVGPETLLSLRRLAVKTLYSRVREQGWKVL